MIIKVLMENTTKDTAYMVEHGLSLYIETNNHKILFDTGQTDGFIENANKLEVDLSAIDIAFLSHGHYDHGGGLKAFLDINHQAKVYIHGQGFLGYYSRKSDDIIAYIGLDQSLRTHEQIVFVNKDCLIDDELEILTDIGFSYPLPTMNHTLMKKVQKQESFIFEADQFSHEQNLIIKEGDKQVLIAGCAHKGIMNIMEAFKLKKGCFPAVVLSGFHLSSDRSGFMEKEAVLETISDYFLGTDTLYYTGHCTGVKPFDYFQGSLGRRIQYMYTGRIINI